jgi:ribosome-associated translation inhibitor RaiA
MHAHIEVSFRGSPRDPALEAAVHRWVSRLEPMVGEDVLSVDVTIELSRRRTAVSLKLCGGDDDVGTATTSHTDPYVAVSDAFRAARQQLLERRTPTTPGFSPARER